MTNQEKSASEILQEVTTYNSVDIDKITLFEIKTALHERGFGILMLLFALPLAIPLPVPPGYTTVLSLPLLLFSIQLLLGFDSPWLPKWLAKKAIKRTTLALIVEKTAPILKRIEKLMRPRLRLVFGKTGEKLIALIAFLCAISIAIPLPLTNFIPAIGIAVMSLGLLSKDGLMIIIGMLASFFGLFITSIVLIAGPKIVIEMFSFLSGFM